MTFPAAPFPAPSSHQRSPFSFQNLPAQRCVRWYNSRMSKPRGNPNWCAPQLPSSADPTVSAFELQTKKLGLRPDDFVGSEDLKEWARKNKDQKFVPSDLLQAWGFNS